MTKADQSQRLLTEYLAGFLTDQRKQKIEDVLFLRTRYVTVVLEDIHKSQNGSAVLRTAEAMGVQDVYLIQNKNPFRIHDGVARGASKWLTLHRFSRKGQNNTPACFAALRQKGYYLVAASPHADGWSLEDIPLDRKLAFIFGNELEGLSDYAYHHADAHLRLPMYGFTESYNISVSVAITLAYVLPKLRRLDVPWPLTGAEKAELRLKWYRRSIDHIREIEAHFWREIAPYAPPASN